MVSNNKSQNNKNVPAPSNGMNLPLLRDAKNLNGKRVLVRIDLNIPIKDGVVVGDFRIKKVLPTIAFLRDYGATVILLSHHSDVRQSFEPIIPLLEQHFPIHFVVDIQKDGVSETIHNQNKDTVILLENLRFHAGEKENNQAFAQTLAALGDVYVNDAFSVSHRKHASIITLPMLLPSYAGFLFADEIRGLSNAFNPEHPFLFILGGAKMQTKIPLIKKFLNVADNIFIGGALANNFFREQGYEIGKSVADDTEISANLLENEKILLPVDVAVMQNGKRVIKLPNEVLPEEKILDAGPQTVKLLKGFINDAQFILWNGPMGVYLEEEFRVASVEIMKLIAHARGGSIIGGGDTTALISQFDMEDQFDFLSTAGGAMLEFLATETLPGIEALQLSGT